MAFIRNLDRYPARLPSWASVEQLAFAREQRRTGVSGPIMTRPVPTLQVALVIALAGASLAAAGAPASASAAGKCDRFASPSGSDRARGSRKAPYRTAQRLVNSLRPGRTGCLRAGKYRQSKVTVSHGGRRGSRVRIRGYPGERARLIGQLWITNRANYVTVSHLVLDGSGAPRCASGSTCKRLPSPALNGDHLVFAHDNVTNHHTGTCFLAGGGDLGRVRHLLIKRNRIHDCGRRPPTNYDHGIYLGRSSRARIVHNRIRHNADRGIQLYPDAQRTYIAHNLIDGNGIGVLFSGGYGVASSHNIVKHNRITHSRRYNVGSYYPARNPIGVGNVVRHNCISGAQAFGSHLGFRSSGNRSSCG